MKCPHCSIDVDSSRVLATESKEERVAAGTDAEAWFWRWWMSCQGCLGTFSVRNVLAEDDEIRKVSSGAACARLRERLAKASDEGRLDAELREVLPSEMLVLGIPELFPFVIGALGASWKLRLAAQLVDVNTRVDMSGPDRMPPREMRASRGPKSPTDVPAGTALTLAGIRENAFVFTLPSKEEVSAPARLVSLGDRDEAADVLVVKAG